MIIDKIINENYQHITGMTDELKGIYVYKKFKQSNKSILFVTSTLYEANKFYQIINDFTDSVYLFPMDDFLTSEALAISPELEITRLETLTQIIDKKSIVITNLMGYLRFLPEKKIFTESFINIYVQKEYDMNKIVQNLLKIGYKRESLVSKTGQIAVRGSVLDVFPLGYDNPVRIDFWGDEVDTISEFDINNQLTKRRIKEVSIKPVTEFISGKTIDETSIKQRDLIKYDNVVSIYNYLDESLLLINNYHELINYNNILFDEICEYKNDNNISKSIKFMHDFSTKMCKTPIYLSEFHDKLEKIPAFDINSKQLSNYKGSLDNFQKYLNDYLKNNKTIIICFKNRYNLQNLIDYLDQKKIVVTNNNEIFKNKINLIIKNIQFGFILGEFVVISEREIFNRKASNYSYKTNFKIGTSIEDINKLKIGDYVVHNYNGIGIYRGIKTLEKKGLKKDYLTIEYKNNDKVYIPVEKIHLIKKYSSDDGKVPKLNSLNSNEWKKTKARVRKKIENITQELLELYAKRENTKGYAFSKDSDEQLQFEKEFPYTESKDQLKVTEEIKKDMEKNNPMDRLLCGDVGFGKTEVSFRAAFKALMDGKQVALLCPTTLLSSQHYQNAIERFKNYPINIKLLNRFTTKKEQNNILTGIKNGNVEFLIGTHRILSDDINFKNLGLLIIDEEQRFGVKHKEKIKNYKNNIDVLTLSATPIPRTLQMSIAGVRSLSLIETPPINRYPIQTYVIEENKHLIKDAINKELARDGQIFILYNDISRMENLVNEIKFLVPEANVIFAHGRMTKNEIEKVMLDFVEKKYNVLICTTIIETGIDIPSVNTLIIYDADKFGLAQLYQIRGRVGRSDKIAYCYLMYNKGKILSDIAKKRLNVIKDFTELGSGFAIAMRDLSIRGAGDILGSEQSGFIDSVGIELFLSMLNDEINKNKNENIESKEESTQPLIEVQNTIKDSYVSDEDIKIEIHKKINSIKTIEELEKVKYELEDRFGRLEEYLIIYMYDQLLENMLKKYNINSFKQTKNSVEITLPKGLTNKINGEQLFIKTIKISKSFRFSMKYGQIIVTLDTVKIEKHFIYYLIEFMNILNISIKNDK